MEAAQKEKAHLPAARLEIAKVQLPAQVENPSVEIAEEELGEVEGWEEELV